MPLTTLDKVSALVLVDLQKGILGIPTVHPSSEILARSVELAKAFRQHGLPVALVNVTAGAPGRNEAVRPKMEFPEGWTELAPELDQQPTDILISKQRPGAFLGTTLDAELRARGVTQLFLAGIATGTGVEATARSAYDLGYHVVFVTDAMTDRDAAIHDFMVETMFAKFGELETTAGVLQALAAAAV